MREPRVCLSLPLGALRRTIQGGYYLSEIAGEKSSRPTRKRFRQEHVSVWTERPIFCRGSDERRDSSLCKKPTENESRIGVLTCPASKASFRGPVRTDLVVAGSGLRATADGKQGHPSYLRHHIAAPVLLSPRRSQLILKDTEIAASTLCDRMR